MMLFGVEITKTQILEYITLVIVVAGFLTTILQQFIQLFPQYTEPATQFITFLAAVIYFGTRILAILKDLNTNLLVVARIQEQARNARIDDKEY